MNVYELVTSRIIERLEAGVIPWRKCWTSGPAKSLTTGKEYRGINSVLLGMREYSSRYWVTFRQTQKLGGHVKKGEKATPDFAPLLVTEGRNFAQPLFKN